MKIIAFLSFIALLLSSAASAQDTSRLLNLDKCWQGELAEQLLCVEREHQTCDIQVEHLSTAEGHYKCFYETLVQADRHLNIVYAQVIEEARQDDMKDGLFFREEMVRDAQRKWLAYRDAQSPVRSHWARMGSGSDAITAFEAAKLTVIQAYILAN